MHELGLLGLGVMGRNLALNARDHGLRVAGFDQDARMRDAFGAVGAGEAHDNLAGFVARLERPRALLLLVPSGAVDEALDALCPLLTPGDLVVDGGNSHYRETARRELALAARGLAFVGLGISGGKQGARHGPALMAGGSAAGMTRVRSLFEPLAARARQRPCFGWFGHGGAGHFVKMVHNGIEYADMQLIAEAYSLLRYDAGLGASEVASVFAEWNEGPLESFLLDISSRVLATTDDASGKSLVDVIVDSAGQKGTGHWAVTAAMELGVPVPTIAAAVDARNLSASRRVREALPVRPRAMRGTSAVGALDDLHSALMGAKVCAYAQGFALLDAGRHAHGYALELSEVAATWRSGCIIRARLLEDVHAAFERDPALPSLLAAPQLIELLERAEAGWRRATGRAIESGVPIPALSLALAYVDAYGSARLWADLLQGQRDYFGAHGFERIDRPGTHHGPWETEE